MGVIARQTIKSSIVFYISALFGVMNRLFLIPEVLTQTEIGFLDNLTNIALILATLSLLGSSGVITKFHKYFELKAALPNLIGRVFVISFIGFIFFGTIFIMGKEVILAKFSENDAKLLNNFYYYIPVLSLILFSRGILNSYASIKQRVAIPTVINDLWIKIASVILLSSIGLGIIVFNGYVYFIIIAHFIALIGMIYYCKKQLKIELSFTKKINKKDNIQIFKYGGFLLLAGFSGQITQFADSLMLGSYEGFKSSGIYSIAMFIGVSIEMPKRALATITTPIVATHFEEGNLNQINKLYKQSSINQGIVAFLFFSLIFLNLETIFSIIPKGETFEVGKYVALLIGGSKVVDMFMGINSGILKVSKYYYLDLYFLIAFVFVTVMSNYFLIPIFKLNGAAFATLISVTFYNLVRFFTLLKLYNFSPFTKKSILLVALFILTISLKFLIPEYNGNSKLVHLIILVLKSSIVGFIYLSICYKLSISNELNNVINKGLKKLGILKK